MNIDVVVILGYLAPMIVCGLFADEASVQYRGLSGGGSQSAVLAHFLACPRSSWAVVPPSVRLRRVFSTACRGLGSL